MDYNRDFGDSIRERGTGWVHGTEDEGAIVGSHDVSFIFCQFFLTISCVGFLICFLFYFCFNTLLSIIKNTSLAVHLKQKKTDIVQGLFTEQKQTHTAQKDMRERAIEEEDGTVERGYS